MTAPRYRAKPRKREIELDFLRGVAILLVLDFHSPRSLLLAPFALLGFQNFGWCGVDIFFVLSGFLVGGLLVREWELHGRIDSKRFLIRRGFKIWPQYYLFLFASLLTGHRSLSALWGNLLNIQNYVGGIAHTWSLAVEEHAYLLLLGLFAVALRIRASIQHLLVLIATLCVMVVIWRFVLAANRFDAFPRTDARIDGIFYGLILAILYHTQPHRFAKLQRMRWLWLAVVAIALASFRFIPREHWWTGPISWIFADALGVALLLLVHRHSRQRVHPLLYRGIAWVGLYSYGIYLWHVSFIAFLVAAVRQLPPHLANLLEATVPMFLGIAVGVLTTKLVEFPALKLRDRLFPTRVDSAISLGAPGQ